MKSTHHNIQATCRGGLDLYFEVPVCPYHEVACVVEDLKLLGCERTVKYHAGGALIAPESGKLRAKKRYNLTRDIPLGYGATRRYKAKWVEVKNPVRTCFHTSKHQDILSGGKTGLEQAFFCSPDFSDSSVVRLVTRAGSLARVGFGCGDFMAAVWNEVEKLQ